MNKTITPSIESIKRTWFLVDAKDKTLGRLSTEVAAVLRGKNKVLLAIDGKETNRDSRVCANNLNT